LAVKEFVINKTSKIRYPVADWNILNAIC
jgi:hypothetical protein